MENLKFRLKKETLSPEFIELAKETNSITKETGKTITIITSLNSLQAAYYGSGQLTRREIRKYLHNFIK